MRQNAPHPQPPVSDEAVDLWDPDDCDRAEEQAVEDGRCWTIKCPWCVNEKGCELHECRHLVAHILDYDFDWQGPGERFGDINSYLLRLRYEGGLEERRAELVGLMDDRPEWAHFGFDDGAFYWAWDEIAWDHPLLVGHVSGYQPGSRCECAEGFLWVYPSRGKEFQADIEELARRLGVPPHGQEPATPAVVHIGHYPDDPDAKPVPLCGGQGLCVRADWEGLENYKQLNSGEVTVVCPVCHEASEPFRALEALGD